MKLKKLVSTCLILTIVLLPTGNSFAKEAPVEVMEFSEYDEILRLEKSIDINNDREALDIATSVVDTFYHAMEERSKMPDKTLYSLGYNQDEIQILRKYKGKHSLSYSEMQQVSATCTGLISPITIAADRAVFSYTWVWNRCPFNTNTDSSAIVWAGYNNDSIEIGLSRTSKSSYVDYYIGSRRITTRNGSFQAGLNNKAVNLQYPMIYLNSVDNDIAIYEYAKKGTIYVGLSVPSSTTAQLNFIQINAVVAHKTWGVGSPTLSVGSGISFSFTGSLEIEITADAEEEFYV